MSCFLQRRESVIDLISVFGSGQDLVPEPPVQVQEAVEEWRNPPRAARYFQRISSVRVSANLCLGLSTDSKNDHRQLELTSERQPPQHGCAFVVFGQLLVVLEHELCNAPAACSGPAPPQLGHKRWDDILKGKPNVLGLNWTILLGRKETKPPFYRPLCAFTRKIYRRN